MADKAQDNRIFVGGLGWDVTDRQLESAFTRFGKIVDCQDLIPKLDEIPISSEKITADTVVGLREMARPSKMDFVLKESEDRVNFMSHDGICSFVDSSTRIMLERDTGRPRGFGFLTFADRRAMEDAISDMHGREFGDRVISVNKAQPKMGSEEPGHGYGGYSSGVGRGSYAGGDRSAGPDECFKCGRSGHWARDCPSAGGGRGGGRPLSSPPRSRYGGAPSRGDRDRYVDDRYDRGRYGDRDRFDSRDDRYGSRDRYVSDRYPPAGDRFPVDRYGPSDRYPQNGYGKDRAYDRDGGGPRGSSDRYGAGRGGPSARYDGGRSYRERPGPYDRPRRGGRPPSVERY